MALGPSGSAEQELSNTSIEQTNDPRTRDIKSSLRIHWWDGYWKGQNPFLRAQCSEIYSPPPHKRQRLGSPQELSLQISIVRVPCSSRSIRDTRIWTWIFVAVWHENTYMSCRCQHCEPCTSLGINPHCINGVQRAWRCMSPVLTRVENAANICVGSNNIF